MPLPSEPRPRTRAPCSFAWFTFDPHSGRSAASPTPRAHSRACDDPQALGAIVPLADNRDHGCRHRLPAVEDSIPTRRPVGTAIAKAISRVTTQPDTLRPGCSGRPPCPSQAPTTPAPLCPAWPSRLLRDFPGLPCSGRNPCPGSCPAHPCATLRLALPRTPATARCSGLCRPTAPPPSTSGRGRWADSP